jgi:hypothetical protein
VVQVLDWLTRPRPHGGALFEDQSSALRDIRGKLIGAEIHARGRHVTWDEGRIVQSGGIGLVSADWVHNAEFIFHEGEWYLVPWGSNPFAPPEPNRHRGWGGGAVATAVGGVGVSPDFVMGICDPQFRRDEIQAAWLKEHEETDDPAKDEDRVQSTVGAEHRCRKWLLELMAGKSKPSKPKAEYATEAITQFGVSRRAFLRAWGTAIAESQNKNWSTPGRKS